MGRMVSRTASLAANTKVENVFAGKTEEFVVRPSLVRILAAAGAAGVNLTLIAGKSTVVDDQEISGANRFPILPDDLVQEFALTGPTDRLSASIRNTTGAAILNVVIVADVNPIA